MSKGRRTFEVGCLDLALEPGMTEGALEAGLEALDAGLAAVVETGLTEAALTEAA